MKTPAESQALFASLRAKFIGLYTRTEQIHASILAAGKPTHGHGRDHDLMVAMFGALIAITPRVGEMAFVAGLLHSWDRHFDHDVANRLVEECLVLVSDEFSSEEVAAIRAAVAEHSKKNSVEDGPVMIAIKDADRGANTGLANLIRGGQHRPGIPASILETVDRMHPDSTFRNPATGLDAVRYNLEWWDMLRSDKARELFRPSFEYMRAGLRLEEERVRMAGLFLLVEESLQSQN